ncbi:hypothetical protein [Paucibacter sp. DJ2R-2]|uniref:hypothetical protein n=1 Tax=Paucibacter sp. DJ2R-2 TaxID=2893558 RepID=UPI0021E4AD0D|nr:hypothetical protein [Paucibacter sp. DJ2R-2]MCV2439848.1 hypothetical protein [Paucibacter sp. DJ2R-2]
MTKSRTLFDGRGTRVDESKAIALERRVALLRSERSVLTDELQDIGEQLRTSKQTADEELVKVAELARLQDPKTRFAGEQYKSHQELANQGFISSEALKQKITDRFDAERATVELERDRVRLRRTQREAEFSLRSNSRTIRARTSEIDRQIEEVTKDLLEAKADLGLTVVAHRRSIVYAVFVHEGDYATPRPAMLLAEASDGLEINFWVDSSAAPYFQNGTTVRASLSAFPSQRYGYLSAQVVSWSQASTNDDEIQPADQVSVKRAHRQFLIKARINVAASTLKVRLSELRAGMEADVLIPTETQSVLRWFVDPAARLLKGQRDTTQFKPSEPPQTSIYQPPTHSQAHP